MEGNVRNLFRKTRRIIVRVNRKGVNHIRFLLPNNYMNFLTIATNKQQLEINKAIEAFTKGKKECIEWSMVGVEKGQDIIDGYENFCDNNDTLFDEMINGIHIESVQLLRNEIIFGLNGKKMNELDSNWDYKLMHDLVKNDHMFHEFESVIIQIEAKINKNIHSNNKNTNTTNNKNVKKTNTSQSNENKKTTDINTILDKCDIECTKMQKEWEKRELEKCSVLDESFNILNDIEKIKLKLEKTCNSLCKIENTSVQTERNHTSNVILIQDILKIKNPPG